MSQCVICTQFIWDFIELKIRTLWFWTNKNYGTY